MIVICGITNLQNPAGNFPTQMLIDYQVFSGVYDFSMLRIKDVLHMIKDRN